MVKTKLALTILGALLGAAVAGATLSASAQAFTALKGLYQPLDWQDTLPRAAPQPDCEGYYCLRLSEEQRYNTSRS